MLTHRFTIFAPMQGADTGGGGSGPAFRSLMAVLDAEAIARLRELDPTGANGLLERVLRAFETSLQRLLQQLQQAREAGDHAAMRHVAHTLKSSAASIGALELSRLCADAERRLRQDETDGLGAVLDGMVAESDRVLAALKPALAS
jgi:HPt (histidine-containing phosphotransfer) domain-containing protein